MKVCIMQPYFFPYVGYYQLINICNKFIIYDDVNYINKGWIDRNKININGTDFYFKIPLQRKSQNQKINTLNIVNDETWKIKFLKTLYINYKRSTFFDEVYPLIEEIVNYQEINLGKYLTNSLRLVNKLLNINCEIIVSSEKYHNQNLKSEDRIIDICSQEQATNYYNLIGGKDLYSHENFKINAINIQFVLSNLDYNQSILYLLFNELDKMEGHLTNFSLIE